ncbi:MAG: tetratricopeptide repeat protein [Planctomycetaceae bacterium]|nr:tetratricopeptide repeat protein [Planctomycetaceae bacterium]
MRSVVSSSRILIEVIRRCLAVPRTARAPHWSTRLLLCCVLLIGLRSLTERSCFTKAAADETTRDERLAQQFLNVLRQRPRYGVAFDRVIAFHQDRGTLPTFVESLIADAQDETLDPDQRAVSTMLAGMVALQEGRSSAAIPLLKAAAQQRRTDAVAFWYLAQASAGAGDQAAAQEAFEAAIDCEPAKQDLLEIYRDYGRNLQQTGDGERAIGIWNRMIEEFPRDLLVRQQLADTLTELQERDQAIRQYEELAQLTTDRHKALQFRLKAAQLQAENGEPETARRQMESLLEQLKPDSWLYADVRRKIEATFVEDQDSAALVAWYEEWVKAHPDDVGALLRISRLAAIVDPDKAIRAAKEAVRKQPSDPVLQTGLIELLMQSGNVSAALQQCVQAEKDGLQVDRAFLTRWGELCLQDPQNDRTRQVDQAVEIWGRILQEGSDADTLSHVAALYRSVNRTEQATQLYEAAIRNAPDQFSLYRDLASMYLAGGDSTRAESVLELYAAPETRTADDLAAAATAIWDLNHSQSALQIMQRACSHGPSTPLRLQLAGWMRELWLEQREGHEAAATNGQAVNAPNSVPLSNDAITLQRVLDELQLAESEAATEAERQQAIEQWIQTLQLAGQLQPAIEQLAGRLNARTETHEIATAHAEWMRLAMMYEATEDLPAAIVAVQHAAQLVPNHIETLRRLAELLHEADRLSEAVAAWESISERDPRRSFLYLQTVAEIHLQLGQRTNALDAARRAAAAAEDTAGAATFLARIQLQLGEVDAAVQTLTGFADRHPDNAAAHASLATLLADLFRTREASDRYWKAFEQTSDLEEHEAIVIQLMTLAQRRREAEAMLQQLRTRTTRNFTPGDAAALMSAALQLAGDLPAAAEELQSAISAEPLNANLLRRRVAVAELMNDHATAVQFQQQLAQLRRDDDDERRRLAGLETLAESDSRADALLRSIRIGLVRPAQIVSRLDDLMSAGFDHEAGSVARQLLSVTGNDSTEPDPVVDVTPAELAQQCQYRYRLAIALWRQRNHDESREQFALLQKVMAEHANLLTPSSAGRETGFHSTSQSQTLPTGYSAFAAADQIARILLASSGGGMEGHSPVGRPAPRYWVCTDLAGCGMVADEILFRTASPPEQVRLVQQGMAELQQGAGEFRSRKYWPTFFHSIHSADAQIGWWIQLAQGNQQSEMQLGALLAAVAEDREAMLVSPVGMNPDSWQVSTAAVRLSPTQVEALLEFLLLRLRETPAWLQASTDPGAVSIRSAGLLPRLVTLLQWHGQAHRLLGQDVGGSESPDPSHSLIAIDVAIRIAC